MRIKITSILILTGMLIGLVTGLVYLSSTAYHVLKTPTPVAVSFDVERDPPAITRGEITFKGVGEIPEILEILDEHGVKSTFFITGRVTDNYPQTLNLISQHGHELAVHGGYYHDQKIRGLGKEKQIEEINKTIFLIENLTGKRPVGYRAPGHQIDNNTINALEELGFRYDSSVVPSLAGFYLYDHKLYAPSFPYNPDYSDPFKGGDMNILEIPLTPVFLNGNLDSLLAYQGQFITKLELIISVVKCKIYRKPLVIYLHPGLMADHPNEPAGYRSGKYLIGEFNEILTFLERLNVRYVTLEEIVEEAEETEEIGIKSQDR